MGIQCSSCADHLISNDQNHQKPESITNHLRLETRLKMEKMMRCQYVKTVFKYYGNQREITQIQLLSRRFYYSIVPSWLYTVKKIATIDLESCCWSQLLVSNHDMSFVQSEEVVFDANDYNLLSDNNFDSQLELDPSLLVGQDPPTKQPWQLSRLKHEILALNTTAEIKSCRQTFRQQRRIKGKDLQYYVQTCQDYIQTLELERKKLTNDKFAEALVRFNAHDITLYWESTLDSDIGLTKEQAQLALKMMEENLATEWEDLGQNLAQIVVNFKESEPRKLTIDECLQILRFSAEDMVAKIFEVEIENLHAANRRAEENCNIAKGPDEPQDPKLWTGFKRVEQGDIQSKDRLRVLEPIFEEDDESMASSSMSKSLLLLESNHLMVHSESVDLELY